MRGGTIKILVIGGTGQVGSLVCKELLKRGADVRAFCRNPTTSLSPEIEIVTGNLLEPLSVQNALQGVDKVYLMNTVFPEELAQGLIAYDLIKRAKIKHIVYQSVFRAERFRDVPHLASKLAIESAIREFDVPFTIVRPNYFMQNDLMFKDALLEADVYPAPLGQIGISMVDVRDIAEAAAVALIKDGHFGKTYNLVGPDVLSGSRIASIWSELLNRTIKYEPVDLNTFGRAMESQSPSWFPFDLMMMIRGYLERGFSAEPTDVETLTHLLGHPPRRYEDFAREVTEGWTAGESQSAA